MDDGMQSQEQPRCPDCLVVMRDRSWGWVCPACGGSIHVDDVAIAYPVFTGPALRGC